MNTPLPIRQLRPTDFGGTIARGGFAYQDHVAAKFCLEMLLGSKLQEVWCETYDDIVLVWQDTVTETVEFVQVKHEDLGQLWTPAKLCQRKDGEVGSSILEKNLARDCCLEPVRFRIVTSLPPNDALKLLTWPIEHTDRDSQKTPMKALLHELSGRVDSFVSQNGHGFDFWVSSALWESFAEDALLDRNKRLLHRLLENEGIAAYCDTVDDVYESLLWKVKSAAEAKWRLDPDKKVLKRQDLLNWLIAKASPLPNLNNDQRLEMKLRDAGLDEVAVNSAKDLRRHYNIELRQPRFLDVESSTFYSSNVPAVLHILRSELDSGQRLETGAAFHHSCVKSILGIPKNRPPKVQGEATEDFLLGCMYEVTARCRHRFTTPKS